MFTFSEIVGHGQIKEHLQAAIQGDKPFHAYIFQGEVGVGKETVARTFAAGLQCQGEGEKPCTACVSCRQIESGNQPDVIWVTRDRSSLGVEEIREQLCNTMEIKPFSSPYKIAGSGKNDRGGAERLAENDRGTAEIRDCYTANQQYQRLAAHDPVPLPDSGIPAFEYSCRRGIFENTLSGAGLSGEGKRHFCTGQSGKGDALCPFGGIY